MAGIMAPASSVAREIVRFNGYAAGTIVVKTNERRLYYVLDDGKAIRYPVGVGRAGKAWSGTAYIEAKYIKPGWTPPAEIKRDKRAARSHTGWQSEKSYGCRCVDPEPWPVRYSWHQQTQFDWRVRVLWMHPHVQSRCYGSVWARQLGNEGRRISVGLPCYGRASFFGRGGRIDSEIFGPWRATLEVVR